MNTIEEKLEELLAEIRKTEIYAEYKKQETILEKNPVIRDRVEKFRANNFHIQSSLGDDGFEISDRLMEESAELRRIPEVNAYLDSEVALCHMIRKVCRKLTEGIDMHVPEI